jgi:hypothetical protein
MQRDSLKFNTIKILIGGVKKWFEQETGENAIRKSVNFVVWYCQCCGSASRKGKKSKNEGKTRAKRQIYCSKK